MSDQPILLLHGIRGARLALRRDDRPEVIWELANEQHPERHLMALHVEANGRAIPLNESRPLFPLDLEPSVYGELQARFANRLIAPPWDWRLAPAQAMEGLDVQLPPTGPIDVIAHSMGLHMLAELLLQGGLPLERLRRVVLVTAPFGGSLDIMHVLLLGCDPAAEDQENSRYGALVRSFPALYHLLPHPGYGLVLLRDGSEPDLLDPSIWPVELFGADGQYRQRITGLLRNTSANRNQVDRALELLSSLGKKLIILRGKGERTPDRLQLSESLDVCTNPVVEFSLDGDGRLPLRCQSPAARMPGRKRLFHCHTFGSEASPVRHGEILQRPDVLDFLDNFLA